ncbi:MAG: FAD:protein FMN transferase [bacterium]|nr:FAD:protein FMN transferase [bacterium]
MKKLIFPLILLYLASCSPDKPGRKTLQQTLFYFDTVITITLCSSTLTQERFDSIMESIKAMAGKYDLIFNLYNKKSEIHQLQGLKPGRSYPVKNELYGLLCRCKKYYDLTEGAFDITVGRITRLYNFHDGAIPGTNMIRTNLKYVGMDKVFLADHRIRVAVEGMTFDMGGVAKGYIADCFSRYLREQGCTDFIVNLGGNLFASGRNERNKEWTIGIQHPRYPGRIIRKLKISNKAVVTSGDYERYILRKKKRYHHILNPATGLSVWNDIISVTIIAEDAETADYLSTAFFVMGREKGKKFIQTVCKDQIRYYIY